MAVLDLPRSILVAHAVPNIDAPEPYTLEQFAALAASYPSLRLELTQEGRPLFMPPSGGESSSQSSLVSGWLFVWSRQDGTGMTFDANGGFVLANGAVRSPDASWLLRTRWEALTREERRKFLPLCPDFVVEVLSPTDSLPETQAKMREYMENGTRLGWLINPRRAQVEIYRPGQEVEVLDNPAFVSGDPVLPGFTLDLKDILS
jgi:Uma2 family endonuclease